MTLIIGGILTWAGWIAKGGKRREHVEVIGLENDNTIKVNKYLAEENESMKLKYSLLEKECEKQDLLIKEQKKHIENLEEEIRLLKVQRTLWQTLNV
jgi:hypothetical protein